MHAHSPASYGVSLMIHGAIGAVILVTAYVFNDAAKKNSGIFDVVAGPGDNWNATEAPAPGAPDAPDTVTFTPPADTPRPAVIPAAQPEPAPAQTATPVTAIPRDAVVVPPPKAQAKIQPQTPPIKAVPAQTQKQNTSKQMSIDEFNKLYGPKNKNAPSSKTPAKTSATTAAKAVTAQQIITGKGLAGGIDGGTGSAPGAQGNALTAAERDQMDAYFAALAERIKQAHEKPEGVSMELVTRVEYYVGADGTIGAVKIIRSSGNRAFDDSVLKAFRSVQSIGPRPDGRGSAQAVNFRMKEE